MGQRDIKEIRRTVSSLTTLIDNLAIKLQQCQINSYNNPTLNEILLSIGMDAHIGKLCNTNPTFFSEQIHERRHRLIEMIVLNDAFFNNLLSNRFIDKPAKPDIGCNLSKDIMISIMLCLKKFACDGREAFFTHVNLNTESKRNLEKMDMLLIEELASCVDLTATRAFSFTPLFTNMLDMAYEDTRRLKIMHAVIRQEITQSLAQRFLNIKKTKLGEIRADLNLEGKVTTLPQTVEICGIDPSDVYATYERDYGLYNSELERILAIAQDFRVSFTAIAKAIDELKSFYNTLKELNCTYQFARDFYNIPTRLEHEFRKDDSSFQIDSYSKIPTRHLMAFGQNKETGVKNICDLHRISVCQLHKILKKRLPYNEFENVIIALRSVGVRLDTIQYADAV